MDDRAVGVPWSSDEVPASLQARMQAALEQVVNDTSVTHGPVHESAASTADDGSPRSSTKTPHQLGEAALLCLRDAVDLCDERDAASHLLAADALMTMACEAAAAAGDLAALRALCEQFDVERVAARVETAG